MIDGKVAAGSIKAHGVSGIEADADVQRDDDDTGIDKSDPGDGSSLKGKQAPGEQQAKAIAFQTVLKSASGPEARPRGGMTPAKPLLHSINDGNGPQPLAYRALLRQAEAKATFARGP